MTFDKVLPIAQAGTQELTAAAKCDDPRELPADIPLHFRFDVCGVRFGAEVGRLQHAKVSQAAKRLQQEWLRLRIACEQAWAEDGAAPYAVEHCCRTYGGDVTQLRAAVKSWVPASQAVRDRHSKLKACMKVMRFEHAHGDTLTDCDLVKFGSRCMLLHVVLDLSGDPLLLDLGYTGPKLFRVPIVVYEAFLPDDPSPTCPKRMLRISRLHGFDYAFVFPTLPYKGCNLGKPQSPLNIGSLFPADFGYGRSLAGGLDHKFDPADHWTAMTEAQVALTCLFWACYDLVFREPDGPPRTESTVRTSEKKKVKVKVKSGKIQIKKREGPLPQQGLTLLTKMMKPQSFHFPMHRVVSREECGGDVLEAVQIAIRDCAEELRVFDDKVSAAVIPREWGHHEEAGCGPWPLEVCKFARGDEDGPPLPRRVRSVLPEVGTDLAVVHYCATLRRRHLRERTEEETMDTDDVDDDGDGDGNDGTAPATVGMFEEVEQHHNVSAVLDMSLWESDGKLGVFHLDLQEHDAIHKVLQFVRELEDIACEQNSEADEPRKEVGEMLSQLAFGLRTLQRAAIRRRLLEVGLTVVDAERRVDSRAGDLKAALEGLGEISDTEEPGEDAAEEDTPQAADVQRMLLITAPNRVLEDRAATRGFVAKLYPSSSGQYVGGFSADQFDRNGPTQAFWLESKARRYPYHPYFRGSLPFSDPASVLSPGERRYFVRSFITDPQSDLRFPDGTIDPRQGGANLDPRRLVSDNAILAAFPLGDGEMVKELVKTWALPWRDLGVWRFLTRGLFDSKADRVNLSFGPQIGSYFAFWEAFAKWFLPPAIIGVAIDIALTLKELQAQDRSHIQFKAYAQAIFGALLVLWSATFFMFWRRRAAYLAYKWQNGITQLGGELQNKGIFDQASRTIRPEFATAFRNDFWSSKPSGRRRLLGEMKRALRTWAAADEMKRAQAAQSESAATPLSARLSAEEDSFGDKKLMQDLDSFNEACLMPAYTEMFRSLVGIGTSVTLVGVSLGISILAITVVESTVLRGFCTGLAIPFLNQLHGYLAIRLTDWQRLREDRDYEASIFFKLFFFAFFNTYNNLVVLVWREAPLSELRSQVIILLGLQIAVGNPRELILLNTKKFVNQLCGLRGVGASGSGVAPNSSFARLTRQIYDQFARPSEFKVVQEMVEAVIMYGMGLMFVTALPTAPLLVLMAGSAELRVDAYKLLVLQRFPEARMVVGIGAPFVAFTFVTLTGLVMNMAILLQSKMSKQDANSMEVMFPDLNWNQHMLIVLFVEHFMLLTLYLISRLGMMSGSLRDEQYRQAYFESRESLENIRQEDRAQASDARPKKASTSALAARTTALVALGTSARQGFALAPQALTSQVSEGVARMQESMGQLPGCVAPKEKDA